MLQPDLRTRSAFLRGDHSPSHPDVRMASAEKHAPACESCSLKGVCLPCGLSAAELYAFSSMAATKRRVARTDSLFCTGDCLEAIYAVRSGAFKMVGVSGPGREKVTGFYLPGEIIGLEAISGGTHLFDAIALEDSEVCAIPIQQLEHMAGVMPALQKQLFRTVSSHISQHHGLMLLLGRMTAEQRLGAFLLSLSRRYRRLGYSPDAFVLRMTREEIGSYLGLSLETVSRVISRFHCEGLIAVHQREIRLISIERLVERSGSW